MKKIIAFIIIITSIVVFQDLKNQKIVIPEDAIRFRIIANSNSKEDQQIKKNVKKSIEPEIKKIMVSSLSLTNSREELKNNIPLLQNKIEKELLEEKSSQKVNINYGYNYFPKKEYKDIIYKEGNYESLVITLGDGLGDNFWCVLFPPLCLLDMEEENTDKVEYHFFVKDILNKYIK